MRAPTSPAERIRVHLEQVQALHRQALELDLSDAMAQVKRLQARRFRGTYRDLLQDPGTSDAARFFLEDLYGAHDFSERDRQFARIAGAIEHLFPQDVGQLACDLAELHATTESLDLSLAAHWQGQCSAHTEALRYLRAWRLTGPPEARRLQLRAVCHLGNELQRMTRRASLRMALRMMRRPAEAAGLGALQRFLETGFDAFGDLDDAQAFLLCIRERECAWLDRLDHAPEETVCALLSDTLVLADAAG